MALKNKSEEELLDRSNENIYQFDGLYKDCYIRLESDNMSDLLNALNLLYKKLD